MRTAGTGGSSQYQKPFFIDKSRRLAEYIRSLSAEQLAKQMKLSPDLAAKTYTLWQAWTDNSNVQRPAIDSFLGDIYSGLQAESFTEQDRQHADDTLLILSGLYGALRPLDSIYPYRLEMGYNFLDEPFKNLYSFWNNHAAARVPPTNIVINLSSIEYTKAILPYISNRVITPKFLTMNPKSGQPKFVAVHAKIARGAFASWLITNRITSASDLSGFNKLGYTLDRKSSSPNQPVFLAYDFKGQGLSIRKT